jgi:RNA polymerase sigma factor (sigma-70 family)
VTATTPQDAEDLMQAVAVRAWRGFGSFRRESAFATWVLAIARREAASAAARAHRRAWPVGELSEQSTAGPPDEADHVLAPGAMITALADALRVRAISAAQHDVIFARLVRPTLSWEETGARLGVRKEAAAVAHHRGVDSMRVYLFLYRKDLLGGAQAVREAFGLARSARTTALTPAEAQVFKLMVIDGRTDYRARSWTLTLRAACRGVARYLVR